MEQVNTAGLIEPTPDFDDVEWQRQMDRAFPVPEEGGKRLYRIIRRGVLLILSACDAFYGLEDRKHVDKGRRVR